MYQLKLKGTYSKVLLKTKVKNLKYINIYRRYSVYNKPY